MKHFVLKTGFWVAAVVLGLFWTGPAAGKTFTSTDGKTLDGEVVSATPDTAVIERTADKRRFTVPVAKLSKEDQEFLKQWRADNPVFKLNFKVTKDIRIAAKSKNERKDNACYKIEVRNETNQRLPALKLYYTQHKTTIDAKRKGKKKVTVEDLSGDMDIPELGPLQATTLQTTDSIVLSQIIVIEYTDYDSEGKPIIRRNYDKYEESLDGINFVVHFKDREIATWSTSGYESTQVDMTAAKSTDPKLRISRPKELDHKE